MIRNIIFYLFIFSVGLTSCKKYLDKKSNNALVVPTTVSDLQGMLDNNYYMNTQTPSFLAAADDDYFITLDAYNSFGQRDQQAYNWQSLKYNYPNSWASGYNVIYNANYCLEQIESADKTVQNKSNWDNVKGSAFFFRAYYSLLLLWQHAKVYDDNNSKTDLGIVLRLSSNFNIPSERSTVKKCYEQVISDVSNAILYLPDNPVHPMRPSKAAAYGLMARTYLSMRKYDSALRYADLSLQIKNDLLDYNSPEVTPPADVPFQPFNKEIIFYTTQYPEAAAIYSIWALTDTLLYASYDDNDIRKTAFFFPNSSYGYQSFKGGYASDMYVFFSGIAVDEILLTRAECEARTGNIINAMNDLNTLLSNRWITGTFVPVSVALPQEALDIILKERRKELLERGLRWIDIKRLNADGANITLTRVLGSDVYTLKPNADRYALALPTDIINITGMPQNP